MKEQWVYEQFSKINVKDTRLQKRAGNIGIAFAQNPQESFSGRFSEWAELKATYRFFSNPKITHQALQKPHYKEVINKACNSEQLVLFLQDDSELLFNSHPWTHGLGPTSDSYGNGLMFHSCLVAKYHESKETEILGLGYQEAWVRPEEKSKNVPKESEIWLRTLEKIGPPRANWVSVGDRANDIYQFLHAADKLRWRYVVRARHDRYCEINGTKIRLFPWIRKQTAKCKSKIFVKAKGEEFSGEVTLEISWKKVNVLPPGGADTSIRQELTYIRVWCPEKPRMEWLLITNLSVANEEDALRIVQIYRKRWLIEEYHKAIKTGFRVEDSQLKQANRILALLGMVGVLATRLLAIKEHCRLSPTTPVEEKVPKRLIVLVERCLKIKLMTVNDFWRAVARMGGFIGRKSDGEPGWQTIWKGWRRLQDMLYGANVL